MVRTLLARKVAICVVAVIGMVAGYAVALCWRVAGAELQIYQRNHIFRMLNQDAPDYTQPASTVSHGDTTYEVVVSGRRVAVYKQLINGFQHAYGSALAAFELGDGVSDFSFRAVEYFEAYTTRGGRTYQHLLDTKKDLNNNAVGRRIAAEARGKGLFGRAADEFMQEQILAAIDRGEIISHYLDERVTRLPSLEEYGCWGLPQPQRSAAGI